jgi:predicted transcriptional regulator of viral defense system
MRDASGARDDVGRKTANIPPFRDQPRLDVVLTALAATQHAVVTLNQLRSLGLSDRAVRDRAAVGRLHRIHHAVYALVPKELLSRDGHFIAAVFACGPGAVLSHRSAAALLGLRRSERSKVDVTIRQRSSRKHAGIDVHRSTTLAPQDVTVVNNIPCTTVARTLLDLAQVVNQRGVERACDQAEILEVLDGHALDDQLRRNNARPAAKRLRAVLDEHYIGSTPTRTQQAFEHDRRQDQRLIVAGWRVIRTTWRQIKFRPQQVATTIAALLRD